MPELGALLSEHLRRVRAPEELWERVQNPYAAAPRVSPRRSWVWALAAVVLLAGLVRVVKPRSYPLEFRSNDASQIRAWVKNSAGLDVPLQQEPSVAVRVVSARLLPGKNLSVELNCRTTNREFQMIVAKNGSASGESTHRFSNNGSGVVSWGMQGQSYLLASATAEDLQLACYLCHTL